MHIKLRKYYFINKFDTNIIDKLDKRTSIIYRNYSKKKIDPKTILEIKNYCKKKRIQFLVSNNIKLSIKLDLDGCYIPSFNKDYRHLNYSLKTKFTILGSAHSLKEIKIKENQRTEKIFLSSLFKKNDNFLGIYRFNSLANLTNKEVIALGGISQNNVRKLKLTLCKGFAGISFFEKKGP